MNPLTPNSTKKLLQDLGHSPKKKLGQNFLIDGNIVRKSLSLADFKEGDTVVEIGPGLGTLSNALLEVKCSLYAIEKDPTLATHLKDTLVKEYPNFYLKEGDALDFPLAGLPKSEKNFKIIANLPYAISTPWMEKILSGPLPEKMVLMVQKEAADRFCAQPGTKNMSAISIYLNAAYQEKSGHKVSRKCFYPQPNVDSTLLHLEKKVNPFTFNKTTKNLIRTIFTQRRKQIASICKKLLPNTAIEAWLKSLEENNLPLNLRPEALPFSAWEELDSYLKTVHE